jgi:drug/metabolite transporter (DMT)-like permease
LLGSLFIALWLLRQNKLAQLRAAAPKIWWLLVLAGLSMAINNIFFMSALRVTSVAVALLTHYLMPLFITLLFGPWLLNERPTARDVAITLVGLTGLAIILWPDIQQASLNLGALLGTLSAVFFALSLVASRQLNVANVDGEIVAFYQNFVPAVVMAPALVWFLGQGIEFTRSDWLGIAYFGLGSMGVGFILFFMGLKFVHKASHASMMSYGEPIAAILLAALFLGEPITAYIVVGGALIVGAGVVLIGAEKAA